MADAGHRDEPEEPEGAEAESPGFEIPQFALVVSPTPAKDGWHIAALVREVESPEFYLRSLRVRWPFVIARPMPSTRQSEVVVPKEKLSPTGTTPLHRLVVNWAWYPAENDTQQLRFYVRRDGLHWFRPQWRLRLWLGLKEQQPPQRRFSVRLRSNPIDWGARPDTPEQIAEPEPDQDA